MDYFPLYYDTVESVDELSDEDAGKLLKALLHAGTDDDVEKPEGESRFLFMELRRRAKRAQEKHDSNAESHRACGKKGGRPKKVPSGLIDNPVGSDDNHEDNLENQKNQMVFEETKRTHKEKEKEIKEDSEEKSATSSWFSDEPDDLMREQQEIDNVIELAERSGFDGGDTMRFKVTDLVVQYGTDWVKAAIDEAVDHNAISLAYMRKVLGSYKARGGPTVQTVVKERTFDDDLLFPD